jgi:hypothetical protein
VPIEIFGIKREEITVGSLDRCDPRRPGDTGALRLQNTNFYGSILCSSDNRQYSGSLLHAVRVTLLIITEEWGMMELGLIGYLRCTER